ncbi:glycosyltransferase family 4 protein [Acuticoccus sp.]|uniref:glycosyltransferase family 4 protein n=1 Tax=Acuticoccus sp. TaxID=1904378 RepID=UPI003B524537
MMNLFSSSGSDDRARLRILAPTRYVWTFSGPRRSRHKVIRKPFVPFSRIDQRIEGLTVFPPTGKRIDLVHAFNRVPIGTKPFVIGFESHLPRAFGTKKSRPYRWMIRTLVSQRCRSIVAISEFAKNNFLHDLRHCTDDEARTLQSKVVVRLPSVRSVAPTIPPKPSATAGLRLLFVGSHFARKGGCVALRIAELAHERGLPITLDIVSDYQVGAISWTDPTNPDYYTDYWKLRSLPNVRCHGACPNDVVLSLMESAHVVLLPTFGDTFGFSAIEALAAGVPVLATTQGALPEFLVDGGNSILLDLPTKKSGEWEWLGHPRRDSTEFEVAHRSAVEALAQRSIERLAAVAADDAGYRRMAAAARQTALDLFDPELANAFWDDTYVRAHAMGRGLAGGFAEVDLSAAGSPGMVLDA